MESIWQSKPLDITLTGRTLNRAILSLSLALLTGCNKLMPRIWQTNAGTAASLTVVEKGQSNMYYFGPRGGECTMQQTLGVPIRFIQCAVPGTDIASWKPGGQLQTQCNDSSNFHADVMLWYQGETDGAECTSNWGQQFSDIINYERSLHPGIKVVFAQIATTTQTNYPCWDNIKAQQAAFSMPGVVMVKTDDLPIAPDGLHLTEAAQQEMGRRYARALQSLE